MSAVRSERNFDPFYNPTFLQVFGQWKHWRILFNVVPLLTLGIMGGAILPVPAAFATTGIISSTVSMIIIAACMIYTCDMLLWQALCVGMRDYETLAYAIGGRWYRLFTEIWLIILMIGTLVGSVVQVGETCASGILFINANAPGALVNGSGRVIMVIAVIVMGVFVFAKSYRSLELFGDAGFLTVIVMVIVVMVHSIERGLPAIGDGFAVVGFKNLDAFGSALSTFGFMFYLHPVMMPTLSEMPPGVYGVKLLSWAARLAIAGSGFVMYYLAGFFGAADFGQDTEQNILQNNLGGNGKAQGALNIFFAAYVALGLIPFEFACRHAVDSVVIQIFPKANQERFATYRTAGEGFLIYAVSLGISLAVPGQSGKIIAVTGATGVLFVCYFVPAINHYILLSGRAKCETNPYHLDSLVTPRKPDDLSSNGSTTPLEPDVMKPHDVQTVGHAVPDWNQPGALSPTINFGPYVYKEYTGVMRWFHLIAPILACCVGTFASVLTLKGLKDS